jgi:phosphopantothenoylcysteine decarboxylase/phosphopantothenate--cysteine ligase
MRPVLITAGATRNPVDATRFLSAGSSGATGLRLACDLAGPVCLLGSSEALLRLRVAQLEGRQGAGAVEALSYGSTRDLLGRMEAWVRERPECVVVHASAVGDYEVDASGGKIPSGQANLSLALQPAPKILDRIRGWSAGARIVSFKAAPPGSTVEQLARIADAQRRRTDSTLVFANTLGRLQADVVIQTAAGTTHHPTRAHALDALVEAIRALR